MEEQLGNDPLLEGPLHLEAWFYFPIAQALKGDKRIERIKAPYFSKPDLSNLIKLIEDVAKDIIYDDDAQIALITAYKQYDEKPRTEFRLTKITHDR